MRGAIPQFNHIFRCINRASVVLFLTAAVAGLNSVVAQAQYYVTVQPIVICQTPSSGTPTTTTTAGTGCATWYSSQYAPPTATPGFFDPTSKTDVTWAIWHQLGINVAWLPAVYYNNTNAQSITDITCYIPPISPNGLAASTVDPNCANPTSSGASYVLSSQQFLNLTQQHGITNGTAPVAPLNSNPRVINMFFGDSLTPPAGLVGVLYGFSWLGTNGIYIAQNTFTSTSKVKPQVDVLAHELGHNFGLDHSDEYNYAMAAPALDLMTAGTSRTVPTSTSSALSQLGLGDGTGTADQLDTSTTPATPFNPGSNLQQTEVFSSGFLNPTPLASTAIVDPPGTNRLTFTTTGASYPSLPAALPAGWPTPTLIGVTYTLGTGVQYDPANPVKFTANSSYVSAYSYQQGSSGNANCPVGGTQCLVITLSGLPGSASLGFTQGILKSPPPAPPGSTLLSEMQAAGVYITYKFSDGLIVTSQTTSQSGQLTSSSQVSSSAIPVQVDPVNFGKFQTMVKSLVPAACSKGVDPNIVPASQRLGGVVTGSSTAGCPDTLLAGGRDVDPRLEAGQTASPQIASCTTGSSMGVLLQSPAQTNVTAYVPQSSWGGEQVAGIAVVPIEPAPVASPGLISTPNPVNSCAANSQTGQTVCTANNTDVYLLSGMTLTNTLTSGATGFAGFSGGYCMNCGVTINQATNTALIWMGLGEEGGPGLQFLDLANNTFSQPPFAPYNETSEELVWDPGRNLILSPNENGVYDLFQTVYPNVTNPSLPSNIYEFANRPTSYFAEFDSAAEDCLSGIALASDEFGSYYFGSSVGGYVFLADLTQAMYSSPGSPGSWTAGTGSPPGTAAQLVYFPEFNFLQVGGENVGTDGIAVAPGSHLAVVTGEYGGNQFGVLKLPPTAGSGTPNILDHVAAVLPNTPDGNPWNQGLDPHTVAAYVSPNNGKAYAVLANTSCYYSYGGTCYGGPPTYLAVIDIAALLAAPRINPGDGPNNVCQAGLYSGGCSDPEANPSPPPVDLICSGILRYIPTTTNPSTPPSSCTSD